MPRVCVVVAMGRARVIGVAGGLPWRLPADLRRFKALTLGKPILMGRRTHESIGRVLPGRRNLVLSRLAFAAPGCEVVASLDEALSCCAGEPEVMVIGGATVYAEALPRAERIYLTIVDGEFAGDTFFPPLPEGEWREVEAEEHPADAENPYALRFVRLDRVPPAG